jgi:hypothetical protein
MLSPARQLNAKPFSTRGSLVGKLFGSSGVAVNTPHPPSFG